MRTALLVAACLCSWTVPVRAGLVHPSDPVAGHNELTYFDLMRMVVTDLAPGGAGDEAEAHQIVSYRHIEGESSKTAAEGPVAIKYLEPLEIHTDGATRLALMADLGPSDGAVAEFVLLALFDLHGKKPKLLDVVKVGTDRLTGFADAPLVALGHGTDLIRISSNHFNSDEDFVNTELLFVRDDRFQLVDAVYTYNVKSCVYQLTEWPTVKTFADRGRRYRRIALTIPEKFALQPGTDCGDEKPPHPFVRTFRATYRWSADRRAFVTASGNLKLLVQENDRLNAADPAPPSAR